MAACMHMWALVLQVSLVQGSPSLQSASLLQQPATGVCRHIMPTHESCVHTAPSSHCMSEVQQPAIMVCEQV